MKDQVEYWKNLAMGTRVQYNPPAPIPAALEGEQVESTPGMAPRFSLLSSMRARAEIAAREKAKQLRGERESS